MNIIWIIIKTPLTSILSALIIYILYLQLKKRHDISIWKDRGITVYFLLLVFFVLFMLPIILYYQGGSYSNIFGSYVQEITTSLLIVLLLFPLWLIVNNVLPYLLGLFRKRRFILIEELARTGEIGIALDQNRISNKEAESAKVLRSINRWILQKNDLGWFELNGQITGKLTESRALWLVSRELTMIRDEKIINDQNVRDHDYEKKLESLIPNESVDALLELWDENLVSEDDMYDAWEMNSFKKWVWKNEEAGWDI